MRVTLCIPRPPYTVGDRTIQPREPIRLRLRWTTQDPRSSYNAGVLLSGDEAFDGRDFRHLRDTLGAWLEADDLDRVRVALGLPDGERLAR